MMKWKLFWAEIMTPSPRNEGWYRWAVIGCGHVLIAAGWQAIMPGYWWAGALGFVLYFLKERADRIYNDGRTSDGLNDIAFVSIGLLYSGPWWWPVMALAMVAGGVWHRLGR